IVQDSTFDKSDGGLILSARVSEQEISFTNPLNNKITFTNFVKLKSEISADLYGRMKDLVDQNTPYKVEVETTNGLQFKNGKGSTTLTARIYFGSDFSETKADSYSWTKDGTLVANVQEITVDASEIDGKAVYAYKATVNEKVVSSQPVTITNVDDGTSPINLVIDSSNGYQFKNNIFNTTLTAILYQNNKEIDSDGTKFAYIWSKTNSDGTVDTAWNIAHQTSHKSITITNSDVWQRVTFDCTAEPLN
ncbi:hypothetical protein EFL15_10605, partial [Lactococcus cremoris]|nr:hypothetical protein [Lactococcus cremoris]